jgi:hypothetical protein
MSREDTYIPSNSPIVPLKGLTANAVGKGGDFVIILNPGTTGTVKEGANTASAVLAGVATEDFDQADGDTQVETDIGGAIVEVTHTGGSQDQTDMGQLKFVAGPNSVADSGNVRAGRVVEVVSATRLKIKCEPYANIDVDTDT